MSPCGGTALRLLTSVLVASSIASTASIPINNAEARRDALAATDVPTTLVSKPDPKHFLSDLKDFLGQYDATDIVGNFIGSLLAAKPKSNQNQNQSSKLMPTTTSTIRATPIAAVPTVVKTETVYVTRTPGASTAKSGGGTSLKAGASSETVRSTSLVASVATVVVTSRPVPVPSDLLPSATASSASFELPEFSILPQPSSVSSISKGPIIETTIAFESTTSRVPDVHILPFPYPISRPGGPGRPFPSHSYNATTTVKLTSTKYITRTVRPAHSTASTTTRPTLVTQPYYTNTTTTSTATPTPTSTTLSLGPVPIPTPDLNTTTTFSYDPLTPLRKICQNRSFKTVTLPLLSTFYGPNTYPALHPFPGCKPPTLNASQSLRAPGLLNCTLLGAEVQACQKLGRQVLLSVRGAGAGEVGGNLDYGNPAADPEPFGPYFGDIGPGGVNKSRVHNSMPNLFDERHPPSAFALTLFSLFGEGHTERADLRPLGPDADESAGEDGVKWAAVSKPLGEEVVVDGFDVQIPAEWKGTYQGGRFEAFVQRLRELSEEVWKEGGEVKGGTADLGADGKGIVVEGYV